MYTARFQYKIGISEIRGRKAYIETIMIGEMVIEAKTCDVGFVT